MMGRLATRVKASLRSLHRDEHGANMVEYILIIAAVALPLLGVLMWFRNDLKDWVTGLYEEVKAESYDIDNP